ncbi:MAG: formylglycine-generating enzyme family protein [Candidatus Brocadiales bacterium]
MTNKKKSFWRTAPGVLTELAAIKTPIIILLIVLIQVGCSKQPETTTTTINTTSSTPYGTIWKEPETGMEFVFVKGGTYEMGDTFGDGKSGKESVHEVFVDDFWMGRYEVTHAQWWWVTGGRPEDVTKGDEYPVENVSWYDVQVFIKNLNKKTGKEMFRLPTEAEWEYAARSGGKKERFAGISDKDSLHIYANHSENSTTPVGSYKPNGLGLYDMSGNVWEWVQDVYNEYAYGKHDGKNPVYKGSGVDRVVRGGSWGFGPSYNRCAYRDKYSPSDTNMYLGFRLLRTP